VYESYVIDPTALPAFTNVLADKFKRLAELEKAASGKPEEAGSDPKVAFRLKKWYLVPGPLKALEKKAIGVEFMEKSTEQFAIQTDNEVWIDADAYKNMKSEEERATLIAHEGLMSVFLTQREPKEVSCRRWARALGQDVSQTCSNQDPEEKVLPPMDKAAYQKLRTATAILMGLNAQSTVADYKAFEAAIGAVEVSDLKPVTNSAEAELNAQSVITILKNADGLGSVNGPCFGLNTATVIKNCQFEFKTTDESSIVEVIARDADSKQILRTSQLKVSGLTMPQTFLRANGEYVHRLYLSGDSYGAKEGDLIGDVEVILTGAKDLHAFYEIKGIVIHNRKVYSVETASSSDLNPKMKCLTIHTGRTTAKDFNTDSIAFASDEALVREITRGSSLGASATKVCL
jgi:hypothetical protein